MLQLILEVPFSNGPWLLPDLQALPVADEPVMVYLNNVQGIYFFKNIFKYHDGDMYNRNQLTLPSGLAIEKTSGVGIYALNSRFNVYGSSMVNDAKFVNLNKGIWAEYYSGVKSFTCRDVDFLNDFMD